MSDFEPAPQVDRAEEQQNVDVKVTSKKIRAEQEKELKQFRESLKQEVKLMKQEVELQTPKDRRKDELKRRKEMLERDQQRREQLFLSKLSDTHENQLRRLTDSHQEKIALLDRQFLQQKQQLMRQVQLLKGCPMDTVQSLVKKNTLWQMTHLPCLFQREAAIWEMEEKQLHERHQLAKRQLKDMFFLQRHQMLVSEAVISTTESIPHVSTNSSVSKNPCRRIQLFPALKIAHP